MHKAVPQIAQYNSMQSRLYLLLPSLAGKQTTRGTAVSVLPKVHEERKHLLLFLCIYMALLAREQASPT